MDRQIQWLRRYVVWRVLRRLTLDAVLTAVLVTGAVIAIGTSWPTAVLGGVVAAQCVGAGRLIAALLTGPVDAGYLVTWENAVEDLQPRQSAGRPETEITDSLQQTEFRFLTVLGWGEGAADDGYALYGLDSELLLICVGLDDEPMVVLSRLTDGRILLTTSETVPSLESMVVKRSESATVELLIASHAEAIAQLRLSGVNLTRVGPEVVAQYLRIEWEAWDQMGPFVGALIAIAPGRQPLSLGVRLPADQLWSRAISNRPSQAGPAIAAPQINASAVPAPVVAAPVVAAPVVTAPAIAAPPARPPERTAPGTSSPGTAAPTIPAPTPAAPAQAAPATAAPVRVPTIDRPPPVVGEREPEVRAPVPGRYPPGAPPSWTTKQRGSGKPIGSPT